MPRPRLCECGACERCKNRERMNAQYAAMTPEEKRGMIDRRDIEKVRATDRRRYRRDRQKRLAHAQAQRIKHAEKETARRASRLAIARGEIERQPCEVCGTELRVEQHHPDYSKPLEIQWLCRQHHMEQHRVATRAA